MNLTRTRNGVIIMVWLVAALAVAVLSGCSALGSGPKYKADELMKAWQASPEAANWDLEVRDVIGQKKSTGSHDAAYTVFLTTFTNKKVPDFKLYGTVDVPNDDSMTFDERASAFFNAIAAGSEFSGVQDREAFMKWYAKEMPSTCFVRLMQNTGADGKSTWELIGYDAPPTKSTMTGDSGKTGVVFTYDAAAKTWSKVAP